MLKEDENMGWPQIVWIVISGIGLGIALVKHGEPRQSNYNFWVTLMSLGIEVLILYKGGFFG